MAVEEIVELWIHQYRTSHRYFKIATGNKPQKLEEVLGL